MDRSHDIARRLAAGVIPCLAALALSAGAPLPSRAAQPGNDVVRIGMPFLPENLDPARADNDQALAVGAGIHETLYALDPLAPLPAIVPLAAAALPEVSADHRTFTVRVRPGIFFTPHPRFDGQRRELVAADFAYAVRRVLDPKVRSPSEPLLTRKIEGLDELARRARDEGRGIDYDAALPGLVLLDRYTLRIVLTAADPQFPFLLANQITAGVAREIVEAEGDQYGQHPVGTGAFTVAAFTPGHRIVLTRNPQFRLMTWEDLLTPASRAASESHPMRGRKLPGLDRLELTSAPESSAELMALRRGELDLIYLAQPGLATRNGRLREELAREGVELVRHPAPLALLLFLNTRDPVVGGMSPERIALRRAIFMAFDDEEVIRVLDNGFSTMRHQVIPPGVDGHIAGYRSPNRFDRAAANALLDRFAYRRGPDGLRRNPDGTALTLQVLSDPRTQVRQRAEFIKRMMDRIGIRVAVDVVQPAELLKWIESCRYQAAWMAWTADLPDGANFMGMFYGPNVGSANMGCYVDAQFDAAYERALALAPGPSRAEAFRTMQARIDAYAPARPMPSGGLLFLKRANLLGPFGTMTDWLQATTLARPYPSATIERGLPGFAGK